MPLAPSDNRQGRAGLFRNCFDYNDSHTGDLPVVSIVLNAVQPAQETTELISLALARPHLIFFTELEGPALQRMLMSDGLLEWLADQRYGLALAMLDLSDTRADVVRQLNARGVHIVARLLLPASEGVWFNVQNYPQAIERYRAFRAWARLHQVHFDAVGLDIKPPLSEVLQLQQWRPRDLARRLWLAHENVLYPAAYAAYTDLIAEIHHDGYEVHIYQLPLLADDRRAGTTLIQRAFDIVDLPADVEVLLCPSMLPLENFRHDLGGALIVSYGPAADSIGIGHTVGSTSGRAIGKLRPPLTWEILERDVLLATRYTDVVYVSSLEGCAEQGLLHRLASLDWDQEPQPVRRWRALVAVLRAVLLVVLLFARFQRSMLAWLGWGLAAVLFFLQVRRWWRER